MTDEPNNIAPWPGPIDTHGLEESGELVVDTAFDEVQQARAEALRDARIALERRYGRGGQDGHDSIPPTRMDLLSIANWIVTGSAHVG